MTTKPHVVFITRGIGFPHGMAASQRVRLLARALVDNGAEVTVLCLRVTERTSHVENALPRGDYQGIHFRYTSGTTTRSKHFVIRRFAELLGLVQAMAQLIDLKWHGALSCVYLWITVMNVSFTGLLFMLFCHILRVPMILEVNERPWSLKDQPSWLERKLSPLTGIAGAVVISGFLQEWVDSEARRLGQQVQTISVPILVDIKEIRAAGTLTSTPTVLFAGAPEYDETIRFILNAMVVVWQQHPLCELVITGCDPQDHRLTWLVRAIAAHPQQERIVLAGYLARHELLLSYTRASALLIPLFNDTRSQARFPTKIGEYLASGRPIVTNAVGEINRFLEDCVSAYICAPDDATRYGQKIIAVLDNPMAATSVGACGSQVAALHFHYSLHGPALYAYVCSLIHQAR